LNKTSDDFLIMASDGLFDRFSSQECVEMIKESLQKQGGPFEQDTLLAVEALVKEATAQRVNCDNTTAILVALNSGLYDEHY
jgi:serine/threonine protein phosphatase PrpC